jgi:hypothetical protein
VIELDGERVRVASLEDLIAIRTRRRRTGPRHQLDVESPEVARQGLRGRRSER